MRGVFWWLLARAFPILSAASGGSHRPFLPEDAEFYHLKSKMVGEMLAKELALDDCNLRVRGGSIPEQYFRLNGTGTSVHIPRSRIGFPSCTHVTRMDNDLFASRLELEITFPVVRITGNVAFAEKSRAARLTDLEESYPFSLEMRNVSGAGLCFTRWTETGYQVIRCDLRFGRRPGELRSSGRAFPAEESAFVSASTDRMWRSAASSMNRNVLEGLNGLMRRLEIAKYLRDPEVFAKYKNYVIESTESANEFVDDILASVRKVIDERFRDGFTIPNIDESFGRRVLFVTWGGSFVADHGTVRGLSTVYRVGDTAFATDNASQTHFFGDLTFGKLDLHYKRYRARFMSLTASGTLNTRLQPIRLHVHPYVNFETGKIYLEDFEIEDVGELAVEVTGLGAVLNWMVSKISTWVVGLARDAILDRLQKKYDAYIRSLLSGYTVQDITSGKAFGDGP
ncbi:UNVERIFIED_CONTAM: hypothetical protein PYX00_004079 [Menopon gallinae]|uniref:Uncharacterized protein n=1 Tax=Menopon gallinae TaxID=328185 RepID=A0AAW2I2C0_9NEOP